ncbi:hypothetical protein SprV_0301187900 [Sparganum proliferum]
MGGNADQPHCATIHDASTGSANELHGDININIAAPSFSPVHLDEAKGPANDAQTAENRGLLNRDHCIIIQGLRESSASTPRERVAADLEQFQKLLNEMLQPTEDVTVLKAFRLGIRTTAAPQTRPRPLKIVLVYRPPRNDPDADAQLLEELGLFSTRPTTLIVGDFNAPHINWSSASADCSEAAFDQQLLRTSDNLLLTQHVMFPTRVREGQQMNCLDLMFTKSSDNIDVVNCLPPLGQSDHVVLMWEYTLFSLPAQPLDSRPSIWRGDFEQMRKDLSPIDWESTLSGDVEEDWCQFKELVHNLISNHCPIMRRRLTNRPRWLTPSLKKEVNKKRKLWKRCLADRTTESLSSYKLQRNRVKILIARDWKAFEKDLLNRVLVNPKVLYSYIRQSTRNKDPIPLLRTAKGMEISDDKDKAEHLSQFFRSVVASEPAFFSPFCEDEETPTLEAVFFTEEIVRNELLNLKESTSPGPDAIPAKLLKELAPEMSKPLAFIFQTSFLTGCLPSDWKSATITPLFKGGSRASANNYRPVSLTSICCKIMEKIIKKALMEFLEQHHLLSDAQYGFRSGRSCLTNLLFTLERWTKARDEGNLVHAIYIDFKKAFDSVPHQRLLHKLRNAGIRGRLLVWIQSFLAGRSQRVQVGRQQSSDVSVVSGVPQGSVLGPTLFLVFKNDCVKDLDCDTILFADDIKLWKVIHNAADADHLQANLNRLEDWSKRWLMPFNISKCNLLQLGSFKASSPRTYFLHDTPLQQVDSQKDLGVWITSSLKPTLHCAKAAKSAMATLQLIKRAFMGFDTDCFSKIFGIYLRPHLEYAIQAWRPWTAKDYTVLEKVQRRATKMTQGLGALPYETRLSTLNLFPLSYRQLSGDLILTFRITNGLDCCLDPTDYFTQANTPTLRGHPLKLRAGKARINGRKFFFSHRVALAWNALPTDVATSSCVNSFKHRLDAYQASQLPALHPLT